MGPDVMVRKGGVVPKDRVDVAAMGRHDLDRLSKNLDVSRCRLLKALDHPEAGGLARPRGTQHRKELAWGDLQMPPFRSTNGGPKRLAKGPKSALTAKGYEGIGPLNWLEFNLTKKPLSDVAVRKAIATAIDKNFICKVLMGVFATPADGLPRASTLISLEALDRKPFAIAGRARAPIQLISTGETRRVKLSSRWGWPGGIRQGGS